MRAKDAQARLVAQTVFDRPVVLEAGAGTGKTATLVARILTWALGPGWDAALAELDGADVDDDRVAAAVLDGVVAITFTDDAAAEMARRVAQALDELKGDSRLAGDHDWPEGAQVITGLDRSALPTDLGVVPPRAGALLTVLERLRTSTIHAFARTLVARYPVEAGLHPAFEVDADGVATADCVERAVEELLAGAYSGEDLHGDAMLLAGRGIGPVEIRDAAVALVGDGVPALAFSEDPLTPARLAPIVHRLFEGLDTFVPSARKLAESGGRALRTVAAAEFLLDLAGRDRGSADEAPGPTLVEVGRWIRDQPEWAKSLEKLKAWGLRYRYTKTEGEVFELMSDAEFDAVGQLAVIMNFILAFDPEVFGALRRLLHEVLTRVEIEKRRRGIVVFQDLLVGARRLLESHPAVLRSLKAEITQLLVDEMQDTDGEQAEIVRLLGLVDGSGEGPGLFLVGDPKQSIYGWRNADMAVYRRLVREVKEKGGEVRSLTVNFRSVQPVLDEVARLVEPAMDEEEGVQPPFEALLAGREDEARWDRPDSPRAAVEHWISAAAGAEGTAEKTSATVAAELEAEAVARDAAALWAEGTPLGEMAVLMRSRGHQAAYLEALRQHGVPYVVGKDPNYYRTREVIEVMALVRLILDPFDVLALVAVLRSPMVGVPDAALRPLWKAELPGRSVMLGIEDDPDDLRLIIEAAAREVETLDLGGMSLEALAGWPETLVAFLGKLGVIRRSFEADAPDVFLERLRRLMVLEPLAACRFPGAYRLANLDRFFRDLEEVLAQGSTADTVLRHLRRAEREKPDEATGRPRSDADGVRVLTIHGAKGLGFEHVWLVQTHAASGSSSRGAGTAAQRVDGFWEMEMLGLRSPGYLEVEAQRARMEEAERVRLLYVALTRAKKRLVTVGNRSPTGGGTGPLLKLFGFRAGGWPKTEDLWPDEAQDPRIDRDEARWVWLGHPRWDAETPKVRAPGVEWATVDPARIRDDAERLDRWIDQARERQVLPWLGTASEEARRQFREAMAGRLEGAEGEPEALREMGAGQRVAIAVGTAMHGLLERFDHGAEDPVNELSTRLDEALVWLEGALPREESRAVAGRRLEALVERFRGGPLWTRFLALEGAILARELPLVVSPDAVAAVGAVTGAIDLVYRDPDTLEIVIADYKTGHEVDEGELKDRAAAYQTQLEIYARALQESMRLDVTPRRELWFLGSGVVKKSR